MTVSRQSTKPYQDDIELKAPDSKVSRTLSGPHKHSDVEDNVLPAYEDADHAPDIWGDSAHDLRDMARMGKKQVCTRTFVIKESADSVPGIQTQFLLLECPWIRVRIHGDLGVRAGLLICGLL